MDDARNREQGLLFGSRFLELHAGQRLLTEPRYAIAELLANAWDAGATRVDVAWPMDSQHDSVAVSDNGVGMTDGQFKVRWRTLNYDRREHQGHNAEFPDDAPSELIQAGRHAFGRNGVGRFAAFCFADAYEMVTSRGGETVRYRVSHSDATPLEMALIERENTIERHGTKLTAGPPVRLHGVDVDELRKEIGLRFLSDPSFHVFVNGSQVGFDDIPEEHFERLEVDLPGVGVIEIIVFDTQSTDRTVKHHGIAWHAWSPRWRLLVAQLQ